MAAGTSKAETPAAEAEVNTFEFHDGRLYLDGTEIKAYHNYGITHDEKSIYSTLHLSIPVIVIGLDDWILKS